jgi:DNA topoisomerase-3
LASSVVICEKPSQAKAIKAAVGSQYGVVLPARGHILTLKEPNEIREDWAGDWAAELLWPGKFYPKTPVKDTIQLLNAIRQAAADANQIIIATDCDREGQLIGDEIVEYLGFTGTVKRAMFNAEDKKSLQEAFANLKPNSDYHGLFMAGQAREQADQSANLSLTRTATVMLKKPGAKGAIGIGRVKTPVLGIICKRELEIKNFKPQNYFEIDAQVGVAAGQLKLTCAKLPASLLKEQDANEGVEEEDDLADDEEALAAADPLRGKIMKKEIADALVAAAKTHSGPIKAKFEKKRQSPPKLMDLTAMQSACSTRFGWTGEKTLSVAQSLYATHTIITYPRGEAQYLPENNIGDVPTLVGTLTRMDAYAQHSHLLASPKVRKGKSGHFSDKALEGMSHYAIIPNANTADSFAHVYGNLSAEERNLFDLIVKQYLAALAPDFEYRQTTVNMDVPFKGHNWDFRNSGRVPLVPGWKEILGGAGKKDGDDFPALENGETANVLDAVLRTVTTKPPARYTEGALIKVMKEAWRLIDEPDKRARLKEAKGIGTPATRGDVVKSLFKQGQLVNKGKQIHPTPGGLALYQTLMKVCPNVVDPGRTAIWEMLFDFVEKGQMTADAAIQKILDETQKEIDLIKTGGHEKIEIGGKSRPTPKMVKAAESIATRKKINLPAGVKTDSSKCRAFLEEHMGQRPKNPNGSDAPFPPSEKQLAFGRRIAQAIGEEIPEEAMKSSKEFSAWIDSVKSRAPAPPPSEKQLEFARKIAGESGMDIPPAALKDAKQLSSFIDEAKKKQPARPPSDKQLGLAENLADEAGIDLPEKCRSDMKECSAFIDKHMGGGKGKGKGGARKPRRS